MTDHIGRGVTISGIHGLGGIGKTALALVLTHQLKDHYPHGQFYLDLQGTQEQPVPTLDAMLHVLRGFQPQLPQLDDANQVHSLYHSQLSDKRVLLLMDNAADADQVAPLLPPAGSLLLVTSRRDFVLPGLKPLNLDTLPRDQSCNLLRQVSDRDITDDDADAIAQSCGDLPLALRVAGGYLAMRPDTTPDRYAARLADEAQRMGDLSEVDRSIGLTFAALDDQLHDRMCGLSVFPQRFDLSAAAAVWDVDTPEADRSLGSLLQWSLVQWNDEASRYRLHDLVRLISERRSSPDVLTQAQRRHATYYAGLLQKMNDQYLEGGAAVVESLSWFDAERENIDAGFAWAQRRMGQDEVATQLCVEYPDAGAYVLNLRLHPQDWLSWLQTQLAAARRLADRRGEGAALGNLGLAYADLGDPRKAIEHHEQHLVIAREIGHLQGEANALGNLGLAYAHLGNTQKAIEHHEQYLAIAREIGDRRGEGNALGSLGSACADLGDAHKAIEHYEQHLAVAREIGDRRGEGNALGNLGSAYADLGDPRKAIEHYEQRLVIAREIGDRRGEGNALGNLGNAHADLGDTHKAIEHYEQRLVIAREIGDRRGEGNALGNLSSAYADLGDPHKAIEHYEQRLVIAREIGDRQGEALGSWNLGLLLESQERLAEAVAAMEVRVAFEREIGHPDAEKHAQDVEEIRRRIK